MLDHLVREVARDLPKKTIVSKPSTIARPWFVVVCLSVLITMLVAMPGLGMPRLMQRFFLPLATFPVVTTTWLEVRPGGVEMIEGQSCIVTATVQQLVGSAPAIHVSDDGRSWETSPMTLSRPGTFSHTLRLIDRDLRYYITSGDATSATYLIHVLRVPAVAEFRVHYIYPEYTRLPPHTSTNTDGVIEAPIGTDAMVEIRATEPLADVTLMLGTSRIETIATTDPAVRKARWTIKADAHYDVQLTGQNGVSGAGPKTTTVRALSDQPPVIRMVGPADDLCLAAQDILPVQYEASDDYGISRVVLKVQSNASTPTTMPIEIREDRRYQQGQRSIDLSELKSVVGDTISIWLEAQDALGQMGISEVRQVWVSARAIDLSAHHRIDALTTASDLVATLSAELDDAGHSLEIAGRGDRLSATYLAAMASATRHLAAAAETTGMLRQTLLRAIVHSASPKQSIALANLVDSAEICASTAQDILTVRFTERDAAEAATTKLRETTGPLRQLRDGVEILSRAECAAAVLVNQENLAALASTDERLGPMRQRVTREINDSLAAMRLSVQTPALNALLHQTVAAGETFVQSQQQLDFVTPSREWASQLGRTLIWPSIFDRRLATAAQAEALRSDADLIWAKDLNLAADAAKKLASAETSITTTQPSDDPHVAYPAAVAATGREHDLNVVTVTTAPIDAAQIHFTAEKAREAMRRWAGEEDPSAADEPTDISRSLDLAMTANALMARHSYDQARRLDEVRQRATTRPGSDVKTDLPASEIALSALMSRAEAIDRLQDAQQQLQGALSATSNVAEMHSLAEKQAQIAQELQTAMANGKTPATTQPSAVQRDPVAAAALHAKIAASALAATDVAQAQREQHEASVSLARAWEMNVHEAAASRLASVPGLAYLFGAYPMQSSEFGRGSSIAPVSTKPGAPREWGQLRPIDSGRSNAAVREEDPAGYEEALRIYFKALSQSPKEQVK